MTERDKPKEDTDYQAADPKLREAGEFAKRTPSDRTEEWDKRNPSGTANRTPMTEGQWRVGVDFNPSGDTRVREIKELSAALIDRMLDIAQQRNHPGSRNAAMAATEYENAAMNAVKAITKKPR